MTRRLVVCRGTGRVHILHTPVRTLCGLRPVPADQWEEGELWTGHETEALCRSCRSAAARAPEVPRGVAWGERP